MNIAIVERRRKARHTVRRAPRTPCSRYVYGNILAEQFQARYTAGLSCELAFANIIHCYDRLVHAESCRLQNIRNGDCSYEDANSDVLGKVFDLLVTFQPGIHKDHDRPIFFGTYLKTKLWAWVTWEGMRQTPRRRTTTVNLDDRDMDLLPTVEPEARDDEPQVGHGAAKLDEATADILFMRHRLGLTQAEIGKVVGCHQYTVGLKLKAAYQHIGIDPRKNGVGHEAVVCAGS